MVAEGDEGHRGEDLEGAEAARRLFELGVDDGAELFHQGREGRLRDGLAVEADALVLAVQVGAGIEPGAEAGGAADRFDHGRRGAFALGAGDVDGDAAVLGTVEAGEEGGDAREGELLRFAAHVGGSLKVGEGEEVVDGGGVVGDRCHGVVLPSGLHQRSRWAPWYGGGDAAAAHYETGG